MKLRENKQLSYWVKNQRKIYRQLSWDDHTPPTPEHNSALEYIGYFWTIEMVSAGKGPICKEKQILDYKTGNIRLSIVQYGK